jgi:hypothetical protein
MCSEDSFMCDSVIMFYILCILQMTVVNGKDFCFILHDCVILPWGLHIMKPFTVYSSAASSKFYLLRPKCSSCYPVLLFSELQLHIQLYEPDSQIQFWERLRHSSIAGSVVDSVKRGIKKGKVCIKTKSMNVRMEFRQRFVSCRLEQ